MFKKINYLIQNSTHDYVEDDYLLIGAFSVKWGLIVIFGHGGKNSPLGRILIYLKVSLVSSSFEHDALIARRESEIVSERQRNLLVPQCRK